MLRGFTIGGFRNFEANQWIYPLARVNIFIGSNNSGKSNILRYIKRVIAPTIKTHFDNAVELHELDRPRNGALLNHFEIRADFPPQLLDILDRHPEHRANIITGFGRAIVDQKYLCAAYKFPRDPTPNSFPIELYPATLYPDTDLQPLRAAWRFTNHGNGGSKDGWYQGLMEWTNARMRRDIHPHYIKTFRQLSTRLDGFDDEYDRTGMNTPHLIDEISRLERPRHNEQNQKEKFNRLLNFVRKILQDKTIDIQVAADKTHIYVIQNEKTLPLEALGSGIHEVFMLAADVILREDNVVLIEEPEAHLHPILQRLLMEFLVTQTNSQIFITTHSASIIDTPDCNVFFVSTDLGSATVTPLITSQEKYNACRHLGFKPSDLMQSNCVIWIEGPSDRIYLNYWLKAVAPDLAEGIHFSYSIYGGKILSRFSAQDEDAIPDFINMLHINRRCAVIMDSDRESQKSKIRSTKLRVKKEVEDIGGHIWITQGREIENYLPLGACEESIKEIHTNVRNTNVDLTRFAKRLEYTGSNNQHRVAHKIRVAEYVTMSPADLTVLDLKHRIESLVSFIRDANS